MKWQELDRELFGIILSGALIAIADLLIFSGHVKVAVTVHAINLVALVLSAA